MRLSRMMKRDGFLKSIKRIVHDVKKFGNFEKNDDVHVIHRDTISNIARQIIFEVRG